MSDEIWMLRTLIHVPRYWAARTLSWAPPPPVSLTLSVLWRCNCRCQTCFVHQREACELQVEQYERIFRSLGGRLGWATVSGGEPALRDDLSLIVGALAREARPRVITLATNGTLTQALLGHVEAVLREFRGTLVVNLSLDAVGQDHDRLRGLPDAWQRALASYRALKKLQRRWDNLVLGIHTVISRYNVESFPAICDGLLALEPDSYITEIAEQRVELVTTGLDVTPAASSYQLAIDHLRRRMAGRPRRGAARLVHALRCQYYRYVAEQLRCPREIYPCYAAVLSAHLTPDGKLWDCCMLARELGDLRSYGYDFRRAWSSHQARAVRRQIRSERCHCVLANAAYTNMMMSVPALTRLGVGLHGR